MEDVVYWIWLAERYFPSSPYPKKLLERFGSPEAVYKAEPNDLKGVVRSAAPIADKDLSRARAVYEYVRANNIGTVTYDDPKYPKRLKALKNSPVMLYYVGEWYDLDSEPSIGVVGTRRYTVSGERVAKRISYDLSRSGFAVVSGLAKGIDSFSHRAALYNKGRTVAVLGCGIDVIYPPENRDLTLRLYDRGLVLTEFEPGTPPEGKNFPVRNRIISALSDGVLVVESGLRSGTIITANLAFKSGVPVFIYKQLCSEAAEYLEANGAREAARADDITAFFKERYPSLKLISELPAQKELAREEVVITSLPLPRFRRDPAAISQTVQLTDPNYAEEGPDDLTDDEKSVISAMGVKALYADELVTDRLSVSGVLRLLTSLELKGRVVSLPGGKYAVKVRRDN